MNKRWRFHSRLSVDFPPVANLYDQNSQYFLLNAVDDAIKTKKQQPRPPAIAGANRG
jgi:hypothetical protein